MQITLIAAVSEDGFISRDHGVPWHLPADVEHFRQYTRGKHLLVGSRTALEMKDWFQPHHTPIILSRAAHSILPRVRQAATMQAALQLAEGAGELVVCGGAAVYHAAIPWAHRLVLTHVAHRLGAGKAFPPFAIDDWHTHSEQVHAADEQHPYPFRILSYQRKQQPPLPLPSCTPG
jgi:dihydrofolate reductase